MRWHKLLLPTAKRREFLVRLRILSLLTFHPIVPNYWFLIFSARRPKGRHGHYLSQREHAVAWETLLVTGQSGQKMAESWRLPKALRSTSLVRTARMLAN